MMKPGDLNNRIYSTIPERYHSNHSFENGTKLTPGKKELYETLDKRKERDEYDSLKPLQFGIFETGSKIRKVSWKDCVLVIVIITLLSISVSCLALVFSVSDRVSSQLDDINTMKGHFTEEITKLSTAVNDTQGKYLNNPNTDRQVAFTATRAFGKNPLVFKEVIQNYGNAYSGSNGKFTCPTPGIYFFVSTLGIQDDLLVLSDLKCFLYVNNSEALGTPVKEYYDNTYTATLVGTFYLQADDKVYVGCRNGDGFRRTNFSSFTGFLVAFVE